MQILQHPRRITALLGLVLVLFMSSATGIVANADFSGTWTLNESKSELGDFGGFLAAKSIKVSGTATSLTVERKNSGPQGESANTETITFDGKEFQSKVFGENIRKSTAKWSDDGQSFVITSVTILDRNGEKTEIKGTETWKMVDNSLQVVSASSSSFGDISVKAAYTKAP